MNVNRIIFQPLLLDADISTMVLLCCSMVPVRAYILSLLLISAACGRQDGAPVTDDDKFIDFWSRLRIMQEEGSLTHVDTLAMKKQTDSLYAAYGYTPDGVRGRLDAYRSDLSLWKDFHQKVTRRLEDIQKDTIPAGSRAGKGS